MSSHPTASELLCHVRELRDRARVAQADLAQRAGLTRQALSAIENGHYVPNTVVALRLARALHCTVDDLYTLAAPTPDVQLARGAPGPTRRLTVARVGERWIGYPLAAGREMQQGFVAADVLVDEGASLTDATFLTPLESLERTALVLGCDPSLNILSGHLAARIPGARLVCLAAASQAALDAVARGEAHLAGTHLRDPDGPTYNLFHARRALGSGGGLVIEFARWEEGFLVAPGNPKGIHRADDLTRPDVRLVNRELGSGSRALLDETLHLSGIPTGAVGGYDRLVGSHLAAAAAVASGGADVAIALRATAQSFDLAFLPLDEMRFDFVIPQAHLDHPTVARLLEVLQSSNLRAELAALPGYDVSRMGATISRLPSAA